MNLNRPSGGVRNLRFGADNPFPVERVEPHRHKHGAAGERQPVRPDAKDDDLDDNGPSPLRMASRMKL